MLRSLDAFHSESSVDVQLRSQLHYAEILYKKSLYDECSKMLLKSKKLALKRVDASNDDLFNRILWKVIKGDQPYPGPRRMSALDAKVAR